MRSASSARQIKIVITNYFFKSPDVLSGFKGFSLPEAVWLKCVNRLRDELPSQQFNTWIRPLQARGDTQTLTLFAPNRFIKDFVAEKYSERIFELVKEFQPNNSIDIALEIGATRAAGETITIQQEVQPSLRRGSGGAIEPALSGKAVSAGYNVAVVTAIRSAPIRREQTRRVDMEGALQHQHHLFL